MKNFIYKILCVLACAMWLLFVWRVSAYTDAPSFQEDFTSYLTDDRADSEWRIETVYNLWIDSSKSLKHNIRCLFYPNANNVPDCDSPVAWWLIWNVFRYIWFWILVLFLVIIWAKLIVWWTDKAKENLKSLIYLLYWAVLFFWSTWILGISLHVETLQWTADLVDAAQWDSSSLGFKIVSLFKALAFFVAIIMIVIHWAKMMATSDKADKAKEWFKWVVNVLAALILIKIVDYVYYIAQMDDFVTRASDFILEAAKIFGFIVWALLVLMTFYAWFLFITDQWKWEAMKKAKNIIIGIVLVATVIFMLLLIMYQIFAEFA